MDQHTMVEQAYKNGYEKGLEDGQPKWIPVTERLPERGQEIIVYVKNIVKPIVHPYQFWQQDFDSFLRVTHWMPMPEPPKEETK